MSNESEGRMTTQPQPEAPTQSRVRELFDYRADGQLINKTVRRSHSSVGSVAGYINCRGYRHIRVDGKIHKAHRLVFLYHHGYLPEIVDHINGDKADNRIENLRAASKSQNGMNRTGTYSRTGHRNVYVRGDIYHVALRKNQRTRHVGSFKSLDEAVIAAAAARAVEFGEYASAIDAARAAKEQSK